MGPQNQAWTLKGSWDFDEEERLGEELSELLPQRRDWPSRGACPRNLTVCPQLSTQIGRCSGVTQEEGGEEASMQHA